MNRVTATLVKLKTDNGLVEMEPHVALGTTYVIVLETR